jgi:hypothetical protein
MINNNKNISIKSIIIKNEYTLSSIDKKIIKILIKNINNSQYKNNYNFTYSSQKYSLQYILAYIIFIIKYSATWRTLGIHIYNNIYKHYIKLNKINLFKSTYIELLKKYLIKTKNNTLNSLYTDTTFIVNKKGINEKARNKYMKNKNCNKVSIITDNKFIPIDIQIFKGNLNDSNILQQQFMNIDTYMNYSKYFIADKGYCSSKIRNLLIAKNILPIIPYNKRNTKDKNKINKLTETDKNRYKKRINIEHVFSNLKSNHKLENRYEKYIHNYEGLLYLYFIKILCKY